MNESKFCIECGSVLPLGATECPNCGCPVENEKRENANGNQKEIANFVEKNCNVQVDTYTEKQNREDSNEKIVGKKLFCNKKNFLPYVSLIIGIILLIMGLFVVNKKTGINVYIANDYNVPSMAFGGDFYTEIYNASDKIVDELNDINGGMESLSESLNYIVEAIYFSAGMIIISLGLCTIAVSCICLKRENY